MVSISKAIQNLLVDGVITGEQVERFVTAVEKIADCGCNDVGNTAVYKPNGANCFDVKDGDTMQIIPPSNAYVLSPLDYVPVAGEWAGQRLVYSGSGGGDRLKLSLGAVGSARLDILFQDGRGGSNSFTYYDAIGVSNSWYFQTQVGAGWSLTIKAYDYPLVCRLSYLSLCVAPPVMVAPIVLGRGELQGQLSNGSGVKPPNPAPNISDAMGWVYANLSSLFGRVGTLRLTIDRSDGLDFAGAVTVGEVLGFVAPTPLWVGVWIVASIDSVAGNMVLEYEISEPIGGAVAVYWLIPKLNFVFTALDPIDTVKWKIEFIEAS